MLQLIVIILGFICSVSCQTNWASRAKLENGEQYMADLMQETMYEVERRGWSNLKLLDQTQTINLDMYGWVVSGTVTYKNGFLVSIQKIEVDTLRGTVQNQVAGNETHTIAAVTARLNFYDVEVGYDVVANLTDGGVQHFTGIFLHSNVRFTCWLQKNMNTKAIVSSVSLITLGSVSGQLMRYLPATNVTEVLSRNYVQSSTWSSVSLWGTSVIRPIMNEIAANKLPFPSICFSC